MMDGSDSGGIEDFASIDRGIDQPMIAAFHPAVDVAFEVGEAVGENLAAVGGGVDIDADEAIFPWGKGFEELLHQGNVLALFEDIQNEFTVFVHQGFDRAFFGDGYR